MYNMLTQDYTYYQVFVMIKSRVYVEEYFTR